MGMHSLRAAMVRLMVVFVLVSVFVSQTLPNAVSGATPPPPQTSDDKGPGKPQVDPPASQTLSAASAIIVAGCTASSLPANDDGSTSLVPLSFTINFFGHNYSQVYVNNNGNVTFDQPLDQWTPTALSALNRVIIAPFWADVDTRNSNVVTYGATSYNGRAAFCVNWNGVGYFERHNDKLNNFQLLLVERGDTGTNNFDIYFGYDRIQWETGDAITSGGTGGLGGHSARVGYSNGSSTTFELPGSGTPGAFLDSGPQALIRASINAGGVAGRQVYGVRSGSVVTPTATPLLVLVPGVIGRTESESGVINQLGTTGCVPSDQRATDAFSTIVKVMGSAAPARRISFDYGQFVVYGGNYSTRCQQTISEHNGARYYEKKDTLKNIEASARQLNQQINDAIQAQPVSTIYIVSHSMGGAVSLMWKHLYYNQPGGVPSNVTLNIVTLDSPVNGCDGSAQTDLVANVTNLVHTALLRTTELPIISGIRQVVGNFCAIEASKAADPNASDYYPGAKEFFANNRINADAVAQIHEAISSFPGTTKTFAVANSADFFITEIMAYPSSAYARTKINECSNTEAKGACHGTVLTSCTSTKWVADNLFSASSPVPCARPGNLISKAVAFIIHSPAVPLITDSQGRHEGFDPNSGQVFDEIPGSIVTGSGADPQAIIILSAEAGTYTSTATGVGTGTVHLDTWVFTESANPQNSSTVNSVVPGQKIMQQVAVPGDIGIGGLQYYPLPSPVRLLDTRPGQSACLTPGAPIGGATSLNVNPLIGCTGVPASAQAIVGNATVVNNTGAPGFAALYPGDKSLPLVSNLNYVGGQVVPNAFTIGLGGGTVKIYASTTIDFIVDLSGYYAPPGTGGLYFHSLPNPVRLIDSRPGSSSCNARGAPLPAGAAITLAASSGCTGVPAGARAIVGNATVVNNTGAPGFSTLYPGTSSLPLVSNLNYVGGQVVPNAFTVGVTGGNGSFNVYSTVGIDLVIDIAGYYDTNTSGLLFTPLASPIRWLDTRTGSNACLGGGGPHAGGQDFIDTIAFTCGGVSFPSGAVAITGNATVVADAGGGPGYVTLHPAGISLPNASNLNYVPGQVVPNAFITGLGSIVSGGVTYTQSYQIYASTTVDEIVDISGYFSSAAGGASSASSSPAGKAAPNTKVDMKPGGRPPT